MKKYILLLSIIIAFTTQVNAQWVTVGPPNNLFSRPNPTAGLFAIRAIGIGVNFNGTGGLPESRLHVSEFGWPLPPNGAFGAGNLFRTDGLFTNTNSWRMFTGPNAAGSVERFNLTVPSTTSNLQINTLVPNSNIFLNANGNNIIQLTSVAGTGNNGTGQVLIQPGAGPGLPDPFPLLNIGGSIRFSEPIAVGLTVENILMYGYTPPTGNPSTILDDGFRIKYQRDAQGLANADCLIFEKTDGAGNVMPDFDPDGCIMFTNTGTDGTEELAMTIEGTGHVGVGHNYTQGIQPWRRFNVFDSIRPQMRLHFTQNATMNNEVYTDFQSTANGDLNIDPRNTVANLRTVFINYGTGTGLPGTTFAGVGLDINGQENIRTVNQDDSLDQVLVWEPASGNVRWRDAGSIGGNVTADNGCTTLPAGNVQFGQNINALGNPGQLLNNREIPMNNNNLYFLGQSATNGINAVGVGFDPNIWTALPAKLGAYDEAGVGLNNGRTALIGWNRNFAATPNNQQFAGVVGLADG